MTDQENKMFPVKEATLPGYYWWLPEYAKDHPELAENWSVISWHSANPQRQKSGFFVGPLIAPTQPFTGDE